ncbi:hypothetical protein Tdes44962_MAKER02058 [Teratosphaeria destructans]|uniref:Secreted protein n=1 Tax=Teratosphaeria destructans TaxID=418781 RepID=A0A9W7SV74_9PEZI|nr:hypothetical protein Tdes44962_MAKER02058 [Teratosphaeria destructans]
MKVLLSTLLALAGVASACFTCPVCQCTDVKLEDDPGTNLEFPTQLTCASYGPVNVYKDPDNRCAGRVGYEIPRGTWHSRCLANGAQDSWCWPDG